MEHFGVSASRGVYIYIYIYFFFFSASGSSMAAHGTESEYHILLFDLGDPMKADLGSLGTVICMVGEKVSYLAQIFSSK